MGMVFGDIFCCYPFLLDSVHRVGPGTSTQGLHSCIPLLSVRVSSLCSPGPSLCLTKHGIRAFVFLCEFFITFGRGEWVYGYGRRFHAIPLATSSTSQWIPSLRLMDSPTFLPISRSTCFGALRASTSVYQDQ